ncbi:MAG: glycoside hydrolase domain-containing protein [Pseudomonadota bacterium]
MRFARHIAVYALALLACAPFQFAGCSKEIKVADNTQPDRQQDPSPSTAPDKAPPNIPTGLSASAVRCTQIDFSWDAATDTGGSGLKGYNVYRDGAILTQVLDPATSMSDTGLAASTGHSYTVSSVDSADNESAQSPAASTVTPACPSGGLTVWVAPSLARVGPSDAAGTLTQVELYAARGEYESFQVVVRAPTGGLTNVRVSSSSLAGPAGSVIAARNVTLFREHYVFISESSPDWRGANRPSGTPGWFPDGLIPSVDPDTGAALSGAELTAFPFALNAGNNQPIWIDIFVPRGITAGRYTGTINVTANEGNANVSVGLTVWGFDLPVQPSLKSSFSFTGTASTAKNKELLRNRLMPIPVDSSTERALIDGFGLNSTETGPWGNSKCDYNTKVGSMDPAPSVSTFQQVAAAHQSDLLRYVYSADEIGACASSLAPTIKAWARNMHQAGLKNLITMSPVPELYDDGSGTGASAVDIWVMLPVLYDGAVDRVNYVLAKGDMAWSYNCLVQDYDSPKWEIDFAPINFRIQPGFINQSLGLSGLLYWRVDVWTDDPWNNVDYVEGGGHYPGEAKLVYPGTQVGIPGVAPSIRLKWLRDGVDDYDYIQILKERGQSDFALNVARTVGQDWHTWTRDPVALESARQELGQEIHDILNP